MSTCSRSLYFVIQDRRSPKRKISIERISWLEGLNEWNPILRFLGLTAAWITLIAFAGFSVVAVVAFFKDPKNKNLYGDELRQVREFRKELK